MRKVVITSYSIHYTKLYEFGEGRDTALFRIAGHVNLHDHIGNDYDYWSVITSYSIHYTKLYEEEIILNGISKATDPSSGGRHMSNHLAKPEWNIHSVSSATGNHTLHAVGVARAIKYYDEKVVSISSLV